jgi:Ion transport protein
LILAVINESFLNQADHSSNKFKDGSRVNTESMNESVAESPRPKKFMSDDDLGSPSFMKKSSELIKKSNFKFQSNPEITRTASGLNSARVADRANKNKTIKFFYKIVLSNWFMFISFTLILINTVTLSLDSYPINKSRQNALDTINIVLTIGFFFEMIIRMIGFGLKEYARDRFNLFDSLIVIMGVIEVILVNFAGISIGLNVLTGFRLLRLFRLFKLARSWESLRLLIQIFIAAIPDIKNFLILVLLFVVISALLGQELFAYKIFV